MRQKIKDHYKTEYSSSEAGLTISDDEIDFIIKHDCKCSTCGDSIFEMQDFPELVVNDDELRCEDCYDEDYRAICPICESSYDIYDGESEYEVAVEGDDLYKYPPGIYKDAKLVVAIKINEFKKIEYGEHCSPVYSDKICNDCAKKYTKKENFLMIDSGIPCLLIEKDRYGSFNDWPIERLKMHRKRMIHQRITCRGIIEKANKIEQVEI